jgi:hypothetical protein
MVLTTKAREQEGAEALPLGEDSPGGGQESACTEDAPRGERFDSA